MNANIITTPRPCSVTIANTKGGTAKTTTALNLSTELSKLKFSVLLIDLDPQGSLSKAMLGERELSQYQGIEELLGNGKLHPAEYITPTKVNNVSILPCHSELSEVAVKLLMNASFFSLKDLVRKIVSIDDSFDFILIDTQPSKNILMLNAFAASDFVLIPTNPSVYPLMDIVELEETIKATAMNSNPVLSILGVLITMVQRATVYKQLEHDVREYFKDRVFTTTISRAAKSEESAVEGVGVSELDPKCKLSSEYRALTLEILERLGVAAETQRHGEEGKNNDAQPSRRSDLVAEKEAVHEHE
jgi:chromosome partitioning protein